MTSFFAAARELRALAGEVAAVDLRHPAWLSLVGGTALLEALAAMAPAIVEEDGYAAYLSANGGPRSDTFMARDHVPAEDPAERIARAVLRALAACKALELLDGTLPGQPLQRALGVEGGWLRRVPLARPKTATFVTPRGAFIADLTAAAQDLAHALARVCTGAPPDGRCLTAPPGNGAPLPTAIAVDLAPQPESSARHLHRRAWSSGGGPWLGVGETDRLELVTTCHLTVDGFGHGLIAAEIFKDLDSGVSNVKELAVAARRGLGDAGVPRAVAPPIAGALPLGFAGRVVPRDQVGFARVAYALGCLLDRLAPALGRTRRGFSPTFQIPVAPGGRDDVDRRRRRVLFGLVALKKHAGEIETLEAFKARLGSIVAREAAAQGLLSRIVLATATSPLPRALKRRLLSSRGEARPLVPPVEVLAGRAQVSMIRYAPAERPPPPLYALSAPGLMATPRDPFGSFVTTLVDHGETCTITVGGTGRAGTATGARELLDALLAELTRVS